MILLSPISSSIGMILNGGSTASGGVAKKTLSISGIKAGVSADAYLQKVYNFLSAVAPVVEFPVMMCFISEKNELSNE